MSNTNLTTRYQSTATEVERQGFKVFGNYKVSFNNGLMITTVASTKGKRKFRPEGTATPCMQCNHLAYSICSLYTKNGEWPVEPSCQATIKDGVEVPAELDYLKPSSRRCPDFVPRESTSDS